MLRWFHRLYLKLRLSSIDGQLEAERDEQDKLSSLMWLALEEQDGLLYTQYAVLRTMSKRVVSKLQTQRDQITRQLQGKKP